MQHTKETIQALLLRTDNTGMHSIGRALLVLHRNQTASEQQVQATKYRNDTGFTPSDARKGSGMAEFYKKTGFLTVHQLAYWQVPARTAAKRIRITKYWAQLLEAAAEKQQLRLAA